VPKTGTSLVRQWRGHAHTVMVCGDGFEYEGRHYRSLRLQERIYGGKTRLLRRRLHTLAGELGKDNRSFVGPYKGRLMRSRRCETEAC
jgi:hypothetical protein